MGLIIILTFFVMFGYTIFSVKKAMTEPKTIITKSLIEPDNINSHDENLWETYRNDSAGFQIDVPKIENKTIDTDDADKITIQYEDGAIEISHNGKDALALAQELNKCSPGFDPLCEQEIESMNINGLKTYKMQTGYEGSPEFTFFVDTGDNASFTIKIGYFPYGCATKNSTEPCFCNDEAENQTSCENVINKIINSFKLLK